MNRCRIDDLPWIELRSPSGKFHSFCRNVSLALGGVRNGGLDVGGHPFDVQIRRLPPGAAVCPFHSHLAQWELFVVRSGTATVRAGSDSHAVSAGEVFVHPPGEPHQLLNSGSVDLEVMILADHPPLDAFYYPDSDKWGLRPPGTFFRTVDCDYFDGEDTAGSGDGAAYRPPPSALPVPVLPFARRRASIDAVAWENFDSPGRQFRSDGRQLSEAVGALPRTPTGLGGHPFDLELARLPAGYSGSPFHSHAAQWEFYWFLSGTGVVRTAAGMERVGPGDVVLHPPGEAHQVTSLGPEPLEYFLVADNPPVDICHYPDSGKWGISPARRILRAVDADLWDGEEAPVIPVTGGGTRATE